MVQDIEKEKIEAHIAKLAKTDKVLYYYTARIIACESNWKNVQSGIKKGGIREDSWGIAQIHLPSHPTITKQQALDYEFAVGFIIDNIKAGRIGMWYGYNPQLDRCAYEK